MKRWYDNGKMKSRTIKYGKEKDLRPGGMKMKGIKGYF